MKNKKEEKKQEHVLKINPVFLNKPQFAYLTSHKL